MLNREMFDYELIDSGNLRRIERFGDIVLDRPCPQAEWFADRSVMTNSDGVFIREKGKNYWKNIDADKEWTISVGDKKAHLRLSPNGQVGVFPEQFENWRWIQDTVRHDPPRRTGAQPRRILNTFSYTGMSTLFASTPHNEVCHVDGAKSAISWAKQNAALSEMQDHHIRWICDDVQSFMQREIRRGKKFDGIILDPPAFGRGAKKDWKIERDLDGLMELVDQLLTDDPLFVVLTCHAPEHFSADDFAQKLEGLKAFSGKTAEPLDLIIPAVSGNDLPSSFGARIRS